MKAELPTPAEILEELADKIASHIERLAPVAFDGAFREMTRYHRFLLGLCASKTPDGGAFSFAEIAGNAWDPPHREWIKQYRRLFERAADHIPADDHFIRSLAYTPNRLLALRGDAALPAKVSAAILDLGPIMVHRLEAWVTKRTTIEAPKDATAQPRLTLAGSDSKAYANVLPEVIGAWEGLMREVPLIYNWRESGDKDDDGRWSGFQASWPFLWQHLSNTAYCLAVATWNEDELGAAMYRDALVRWPQMLRHMVDEGTEIRHRRLVYPTVLKFSWPEAKVRIAPLTYDYRPAPSPGAVFASILRGAHDDVLLLTAELMLFWTINGKQSTDIGARIARSLLRREGAQDEPRDHDGERAINLSSLLLDVLRQGMAGERYEDVSYMGDLDGLVRMLDNMTERRIVPGRIYTPSTLHGREELLLPRTAILAAAMPESGDDGVRERITALAREEVILPEGDRSLRNILYELERLATTLGQPLPQVDRGIVLITPESDVVAAKQQLSETIGAVVADIAAERLKRLTERSVDARKLAHIRAEIEASLLSKPTTAPFFTAVEVVRVARGEGDWRDVIFSGISKAQLTQPPMESSVSGFEDMFVSGSLEGAGNHAWRAFCGRPRTVVEIDARVVDERYWTEVAPLVMQVGPAPVLVISEPTEIQVLRRLLYAPADSRPPIRIERLARKGSYIATIEGVDVYSANLKAGVSWLFSGKALRKIGYAETSEPGHYVDLTFEPENDQSGTIRVRLKQQLIWSETPVYEIRTNPASAPTDDDILK